MPDGRSSLYRVAQLLSAAGNPLVTSTFMIGAASFHFLDQPRAIRIVAILVLCVIAPITWWNRRGVQKGIYTDFDVSQRKARATMYPIVLLLLLIGSVGLWAMNQPKALFGGVLGAFLMSSVAFVVNRRIKISLHAAFSFYFAIASAAIALAWVAPLTVLAVLVTVSRRTVGRHVWHELILGALLGSAAGLALLLALGTI